MSNISAALNHRKPRLRARARGFSLILPLLFGACALWHPVPAGAGERAPYAGLPGGHEGPAERTGPPTDPASWHKVPGVVLGGDQIWGIRVNARTTFKIPGGMGLLYSSHPGPERQRDPQWRQQQIEKGLTTGPSGSLAYTRDLLTWHDYPGNPVLNETQRAWQTPHRVHTRDMVYDDESQRWVAYFGNICGGEVPGIRTVGVAYSKDLVHWKYADGPILTIADYAAMVPHRIQATEEELYEHGRVYVGWVKHYKGLFYMTLSGTEQVGRTESEGIRSTSTGRVVLAGASPEGSFEHVEEIDARNILPGSKPVYWNGRWYSVFAGTWDGQPGFGLAWSDELFGTVTRNPYNPIITVESTQRSNPILFHYGGAWGVLFSEAGHWSEPLPLRLAVANLHPSLLRTPGE